MEHWSQSRWKRAQAAAIPAVGVPIIAALGASLNWKVEGLEHLQFEGNGRRPIMAFWHGRVLTATYFFRRRGIVVMISENFDGEWIARIIESFGFRTSRGSSSRGGRRALLQLKREMERGRPAGFAVDGPRGPARQAQPGAIWLAKLPEIPLSPFIWKLELRACRVGIARRFRNVSPWRWHRTPLDVQHIRRSGARTDTCWLDRAWSR